MQRLRNFLKVGMICIIWENAFMRMEDRLVESSSHDKITIKLRMGSLFKMESKGRAIRQGDEGKPNVLDIRLFSRIFDNNLLR